MEKKIEEMTDKELVDFVCDNVRGAAILSSRGRVDNSYDDNCSKAYKESNRRGKPELYKRGFEIAKKSFGY